MIPRPPRPTRLTHSFPPRRSSDLAGDRRTRGADRRADARAAILGNALPAIEAAPAVGPPPLLPRRGCRARRAHPPFAACAGLYGRGRAQGAVLRAGRSEEHTSEIQSLMRISYAVFCLKNNNTIKSKKS